MQGKPHNSEKRSDEKIRCFTVHYHRYVNTRRDEKDEEEHDDEEW